MRASNVRGDERLAICHGDAGLIVRCAVDVDGSEEGGKSAWTSMFGLNRLRVPVRPSPFLFHLSSIPKGQTLR